MAEPFVPSPEIKLAWRKYGHLWNRPEMRIDTDDIEALHSELMEKSIKLFHPNLPSVKLQPWGLKEFALLYESGVCVIIQQYT